MLSKPFRKYIVTETIVLKVTIYRPVAEETFGGIPIASRAGL